MTTVLDYASGDNKRRKASIFIWIAIPLILEIAGAVVGVALWSTSRFSSSGTIEIEAADSRQLAAVQAADVAAVTNSSFVAQISSDSGVPASQIIAHLTVATLAGTNLIRVAYTGPTAAEAQAVAKSAVTNLISMHCRHWPAPPFEDCFARPRLPTGPDRPKTIIAALTAFGCGIGILACLVLQISGRIERR